MRTLAMAGLLVGLGGCADAQTRDSGGFGPGVIGDSAGEDEGSTGGEDEGTDDDDPDGTSTTGETTAEPETTGDTEDTGLGDDLECPVLGPWVASAPFAEGDDHSHPLPSFAVGDWYYVHTITGGDRVLLSATPDANGDLGPWQEASGDHGGGPHGFTAVAVDGAAYHFRNGHIAEYVLDDQGVMHGDVVLLEDDPDDAFGGEKFVWDSAAVVRFEGAQWVFHLGGFSFGPYDYRRAVRRNSVPMGPVFEAVGLDHPAGRPGKAAAHVPEGSTEGFLFSGEAGGRGLWRATVHADGSMGGWESLPDLPDGTGNERGDLFMAGRALFVVRGSLVFRAVADDDGQLGAWESMPSLPEDQVDVHWGDGHLEGAAWGRIGESIYLTGPRAVFRASLLPGACE